MMARTAYIYVDVFIQCRYLCIYIIDGIKIYTRHNSKRKLG